jgi:hypothetical protein
LVGSDLPSDAFVEEDYWTGHFAKWRPSITFGKFARLRRAAIGDLTIHPCF